MLRPRIIPCLLIHNGGLVKTTQFGKPKYVGDPINAVKIFNEKEVDELMVLDIDATAKGHEPNYELIKSLAVECRMPLCYGGGIKTADVAEKIISLGVEKVSLSSAAVSSPHVISECAKRIGNQSVVVVIDIKKSGLFKRNDIFTHNGTRKTNTPIVEFLDKIQSLGAGEIVINSIDRDGVMKGYDIDLIKQVHANIKIPLTVLGGAGSLNDLEELISEFGIIGAAAGSLFVFKGKYRAVLINYPNEEEKNRLFSSIKI